MTAVNEGGATPPSNTSAPAQTNDVEMSGSHQELPLSYLPIHQGPYSILVSSSTNKGNIGNLHPLALCKLVYGLPGANSYERAGRNRIKITFNNAEAANNALIKANIQDVTKAYIPSALIFRFGIISGIPTDMSENELLNNITSTLQISSVRRIHRFTNGELLPTQSVEIKFLGNNLPPSINIYGLNFRVNPSIRNPRLCSNCLRFGHGPKQCRSKPRCIHCPDEHSSDNCTATAPTNPTCRNCKGPHYTSNKNCPVYEQQRKINKIMAYDNLSFKEAQEVARSSKYTSAISFSDALNTRSETTTSTTKSPEHVPRKRNRSYIPNTPNNSIPKLSEFLLFPSGRTPSSLPAGSALQTNPPSSSNTPNTPSSAQSNPDAPPSFIQRLEDSRNVRDNGTNVALTSKVPNSSITNAATYNSSIPATNAKPSSPPKSPRNSMTKPNGNASNTGKKK